jgi:hypothetical protein
MERRFFPEKWPIHAARCTTRGTKSGNQEITKKKEGVSDAYPFLIS